MHIPNVFKVPIVILSFATTVETNDLKFKSPEDVELYDLVHPHEVKILKKDDKFINFTWMAPTRNASAIQSYKVYYFKTSVLNVTDCPPPENNTDVKSQSAGNKTYLVLKALESGTTYSICIQVNYINGVSNFSDIFSTTTLGFGADNNCNCTVTDENLVDQEHPCDSETGRCKCKTKYQKGPLCDQCVAKYFKHSALGCQPCHCNSSWATGECNLSGGSIVRCECTGHHTGVQCDQCAPGTTYNVALVDCVPCDCNGNEAKECNPYTGECYCNKKTEGFKCELCRNGYIGNALNQTCQLIGTTAAPMSEDSSSSNKTAASGHSDLSPTQHQVSPFHEISVIMTFCVALACLLIVIAVKVVFPFLKSS